MLKILVVEDDRALNRAVCAFLENNGFGTTGCFSADEAYAASKILIGILAGACFLLAFFVGGVFGGAAAGLSFDLGAAGAGGLVMCMIAKIALLGVFVPIFVTMSVIARPRSWMSILLSLFAGMLLFMMIPMMSPLDAGIMHAGLCLAGGAMFSLGLGAVSCGILKRVSLV